MYLLVHHCYIRWVYFSTAILWKRRAKLVDFNIDDIDIYSNPFKRAWKANTKLAANTLTQNQVPLRLCSTNHRPSVFKIIKKLNCKHSLKSNIFHWIVSVWNLTSIFYLYVILLNTTISPKVEKQSMNELVMKYFGLLLISLFCLVVVWNLVTIAAERYLAVCRPFKHNDFTRGRVTVIFGLIYVLACPLCTGAAFQVRAI